MSFIVAIDGPAGSGKGTVAKKIAEKLGFINIDTGAMYRCVTLEIINNNVSLDDENKIKEILDKIKIELKKENGENKVYLNGEDVTKKIREKEVTSIVSEVSSLKIIRLNLVGLQRKMAENKSVVMEGRDIGTYVFPNADVKIYLDATLEERARRRQKENQEKNIEMSYEEIIESIKKRDENDKAKEIGALKKADDAILLDTTNLSIDEVEERIIEIINKKQEKPKISKVKKEMSLWTKLQRGLILGILKIFYIIFYRIKVIGEENIPEEGAYILCANHVEFFKVPILEVFIKRDVIFIAKEELYHNPFLAHLGKLFSVIPIKRGKQDIEAMKQSIKTIKEGKILGIFPEGTRNGLAKNVKVKTGAAYMSLKTSTPIIPVGIKVTKKPFPKIIMKIGKPMNHAMYYSKVPEKEVLEKVTDEVMGEIKGLME